MRLRKEHGGLRSCRQRANWVALGHCVVHHQRLQLKLEVEVRLVVQPPRIEVVHGGRKLVELPLHGHLARLHGCYLRPEVRNSLLHFGCHRLLQFCCVDGCHPTCKRS